MGEIDTKSIESVQAALSLFGQKTDHKRSWPACNNNLEKDKELESMSKDFTNLRLQLEAKNCAHNQTLLTLDRYQQTADELFIQLTNTEFERDIYVNECRESKTGALQLESKIKLMECQLSENVKIQEELSRVVSELKSTKGELLCVEVELMAATDAKLEAMKQAEVIETAYNMEKEKTAELLGHVTELNESVIHLQMAVMEAEKEKTIALSEKQAELTCARESVMETRQELESTRNELKLMQNLENKLLEKSVMIESLQLEIQRVNELHECAEKAASDAVNDINQLISDMEMLVSENTNKDGHIGLLEMDLSRLKMELEKANQELGRLNSDVEIMTDKLKKIGREMNEIRGRESEAQVEIALLKSEVHRGRSKTAAAEAAEERAKRELSALHIVTHQLALEAEEANNEIKRLKEDAAAAAEDKWAKQITQDEEEEVDEPKLEEKEEEMGGGENESETETYITISVEEYETLVKETEQAQQREVSTKQEMESLKKELESITLRVGEFRTRAEQAACRAEVAEMGKAALEQQIRSWRELRERRKAALVALREDAVTTSTRSNSLTNVKPPKIYQPLGKILKMKF